MSKSFYEEFANPDFFEKQASENKNIKDSLDNLSPSVLEKMAQELENMSEEQEDLEQKLASDCSGTNPQKESAECGEDKKSEDMTTNPQDESKKAECKKSEDEDGKEEEKEEEKDNESEAECKKAENEGQVEATDDAGEHSEAGEGTEVEAGDYSDEELIKKAYENATEQLAENGLTIADYVYHKTASEAVSLKVSEYAEKLATLTDKTALEIADDILGKIAESSEE